MMASRPKRKVTYYIAENVVRAAKVGAARADQANSEFVERALRSYLGFDLLERVWARSELSEKAAMELAFEATHARRLRKRAARRR